ncbi:MAG: 4-hydroxy-tetrahydrodipicolinate reductase [Sedimentisphaerales bacterium]|nr:4-hydroxy-tetrahydrodipicolinate reductase [Sedimentisphaerales bacterium]
MKPKLAVIGAAGRMGKRIISLAVEDENFEIVAAIEKKNHPDIGKDAGIVAAAGPIDIKLDSTYPAGADVAINFSQPKATDKTIEYCLENQAALVLGTTGLEPEQIKRIKAASGKIPVIYGTNMSVGMNVLFSLVGKVASMLGEDYDIEIIEQHHRFKKDSPSGSALTLAENICRATGKNFPDCLTYGRGGKDALRQKGNIGIHAIRAGDITGIHSVIFSTLGETVALNHTAHSRDGFARGALRAAKWLAGKKPGLYSMPDVLGLVVCQDC